MFFCGLADKIDTSKPSNILGPLSLAPGNISSLILNSNLHIPCCTQSVLYFMQHNHLHVH